MLFSLVNIVYASFEITEIMYDQDGTDTNREWIEVKNISSSPEDLSKWFLFSDNTKHSFVSQGKSIIPAGDFAIITQNVPQFNADYSNFQGIIFDSSWTGFSNTSETISLKDPDLNIKSPVTYTSGMGGSGNSKSLSKIDGSWQNGIPTPGKDNQKDIVVTPIIVKKAPQKSLPKTDSVDNLFSPNNVEEIESSEEKEVVNLNDLNTLGDIDDKNHLKLNTISNEIGQQKFIYSLVGLLIIIGLGVTSFLLIKNKHKKSERISAEDMTIVD